MSLHALLVSNSKSRKHPGKFLAYCEREIQEHFDGISTLLLLTGAEPGDMDEIFLSESPVRRLDRNLPSSLERQQAYTRFLRPRFKEMGFEIAGVEEFATPTEAITSVDAVWAAGGNTFDLVRSLHDGRCFGPLQRKILDGMPYGGVSAGAVITGKSIGTSNDNYKPLSTSPLEELSPNTLERIIKGAGLGALPFSIKPHFLDASPLAAEQRDALCTLLEPGFGPAFARWAHYQAETHSQRTREFHHGSDDTVIGMYEGSLLSANDDGMTVLGNAPVRILRKDEATRLYEPPVIHQPGTRINYE